MSFLGLGSFGEGFVKGFAESANEALKENIERINTRIDDIAAFKLKRAIDEQDERKEEKKLIEKAIREGMDYEKYLFESNGEIHKYIQDKMMWLQQGRASGEVDNDFYLEKLESIKEEQSFLKKVCDLT